MKKLLLALLLLTSACATEESETVHGPVLAQTRWQCPSGKSFGVRFASGGAEVRAGGETYLLPHVRAASGARYSNGHVEYWEHAGEAMLAGAPGGPYEHCRR